MNSLVKRAASPTPKFFRKLRNIALITGTIATGILAWPIALPYAVLQGATVLACISGTAVTVSQLTKKIEEDVTENDIAEMP